MSENELPASLAEGGEQDLISREEAIEALQTYKAMKPEPSQYDDSAMGREILDILDGEHSDTIDDCISLLIAVSAAPSRAPELKIDDLVAEGGRNTLDSYLTPDPVPDPMANMNLPVKCFICHEDLGLEPTTTRRTAEPRAGAIFHSRCADDWLNAVTKVVDLKVKLEVSAPKEP